MNSDANGMWGHAGAEITQIRVPDMERIRNVQRQRTLQLKAWQQYDRKMEKENQRLQRKGLATTAGRFNSGRSVRFPESLILLEAAARGDLDEVRRLLSSGVCPDVCTEDGLTALHQCCIDNNVEMCRLLLRFRANVNARDSEMWTPLHAAAACCHTELCRILMENGAELLAMNTDGCMPYDSCESEETLDVIEMEMARRGITQDEIDEQRRVPEREMLADMERLVKSGANLNTLDSQGAAVIHIAAACGFVDVISFLIQHGAEMDLYDRDGWQAIHVAACWEQFEIIELLLNYGVDIMTPTTAGETVFDICQGGDMHVRLLQLKEEMERKTFQQQELLNRLDKPRELVRRRSSTNPRSASIRRSSMREKKMMSWKEAKQEAEMRGAVSGLVSEPQPTDNRLESNGPSDSTVPRVPALTTLEPTPQMASLSVNTNSRVSGSGRMRRNDHSPAPPQISNGLDTNGQSRRPTVVQPLGNGSLSPSPSSPGRPNSKRMLKPSDAERPRSPNEALPPKPTHGGSLSKRDVPSQRHSQRSSSPQGDMPAPQPRAPRNKVKSNHPLGETSNSPHSPPTSRQSNSRVSTEECGLPDHRAGSLTDRNRQNSSGSRKKLPANERPDASTPSPDISAHNAYCAPSTQGKPTPSNPADSTRRSKQQHVSSPSTRPPTLSPNELPVASTMNSSYPNDNVIRATSSLARNRKLIPDDEDDRMKDTSGKCCVVM